MDERITELENKVKNLSIQVEELVLICKKLMNNHIKELPKTTNLEGLAAYNANSYYIPKSFTIDLNE